MNASCNRGIGVWEREEIDSLYLVVKHIMLVCTCMWAYMRVCMCVYAKTVRTHGAAAMFDGRAITINSKTGMS